MYLCCSNMIVLSVEIHFSFGLITSPLSVDPVNPHTVLSKFAFISRLTQKACISTINNVIQQPLYNLFAAYRNSVLESGTFYLSYQYVWIFIILVNNNLKKPRTKENTQKKTKNIVVNWFRTKTHSDREGIGVCLFIYFLSLINKGHRLQRRQLESLFRLT